MGWWISLPVSKEHLIILNATPFCRFSPGGFKAAFIYKNPDGMDGFQSEIEKL